MTVALVAGAATMTGCDDDFDRPPVIVPEATIDANTTILELKEQYWQGTTSDFLTTIGTTDTGDHVIIGGRVVSSDEDGNIYQRIVLEDETSSIFVRIYSTKLFESYQYGQEVRIDVTGLLIGTYRGLMMIGVDYNGSVGGMDLDVFQQRAQVNGLPDKAAIPQYVTTISDIKSYLTDQTQLMTWQSRLITLENVEFVGGGSEMFGTPGAANYTTRQLKDAEGNTLDISTSNKCTFVNLLMPKGTGTVNAILSYYGSNWQLVFSDPETECTGFTWVDTPQTPDVPADGGDGSAETPYTVQAVQAGAAGTAGTGKWVTGYIVGFIPDKYYDQAVFGTEGAINTNILLAPAADVTDVTACIPVALVGDLRNAVGLGGHPENLGKQVTIYGDLEKYFGQPGLKNTSVYAWGDKGGETPDVPVTPPSTEDAKFKKTTTITSGNSYIIVIDGQVGTPVASNLSYGRLSMAAPTATEGDIITTALENAIVFTAEGTGYTMVDTYGRYLSMDDSHFTSFQIYTSVQPGSIWNISFNPDGTASIVNALNTNCNVVRSGTYTNIAPSDIKQFPEFTVPTLYEKVAE